MNERIKKVETRSSVLQIRRIGNPVGLILPKDLLARINLKEGNKLHVVDQPDHGFRLSPHDPVHEKAMEIARNVMSEYRDTFKALAE